MIDAVYHLIRNETPDTPSQRKLSISSFYYPPVLYLFCFMLQYTQRGYGAPEVQQTVPAN